MVSLRRTLLSYLPFGLILIFSMSASATVALEPGTYTVFDRYGEPLLPDPNDPEVQALDAHIAKAQKGGSLSLSTPEPMDLIFPNFMMGGIQQQVMPQYHFIFERMMRPDPRTEYRTIHSHLAESVTIRKDRRTFVIRLRSGISFSDGSILQAKDVVESWKSFKDVQNGPPSSALVEGIYGEPRIQVLNDLEVEVSFPDIIEKKQRAALYYFLQLSIVKEKHNDLPIPNPYIGTGPYVVTSASRERVRLKRRSDYWAKDQPYFNFDEVRFESFHSPAVRREALKAKVINFLQETDFNGVRSLNQFADGSFYTATTASRQDPGDDESRAMMLMLNLSKEPLNDIRVRQAIAFAFDLDHANQNFFGGTFSYAPSLGSKSRYRPSGPPSAEVLAMMDDPQFHSELVKPFEASGLQAIDQVHDRTTRLRQAVRLLREAGCRMENGKTIKNGKPLVFEVITSPKHERTPQLLQLKEALRMIGIGLSIRQFADHISYVRALDENNYDLATLLLPFPRQYSVLDADNVGFWFAKENGTRHESNSLNINVSNLESDPLMTILNDLGTTPESSPRFRLLNDALIRFLAATVSYLPMAEADRTTYFHDRNICVAPKTSMALDSAYFCR